MFIKALLALLILPGSLGLILPLTMSYIKGLKPVCIIPGIIFILIGIFIVFLCAKDFYVKGKGTLAPWSPPKKLVSIGLYRYTRNPMYIGVIILVLGFTVFFLSRVLLIYLSGLIIGFHLRVVFYEEPQLKKLFGKEWDDYKAKNSRWLIKFKK